MTDEQTQEIQEEPTEQPVVSEEVEPIEEEPIEDEEVSEVEDQPESEPQHESRSQQRIAELVAQREEARRRAAELAAQREEARRRAAELEQRLAAQTDQDAPNEDSFDSYEEYQRAAIRYEAKQALKAERQLDIEAHRQADSDLALQQFQVRAEAARQKHPDFDAVVGNQNLAISQDMLQIMAESEVGADVAYHLGKNPAEAQRLSMLPPALMGREIARLEVKMSAQPAPVLPTPINTGTNVSGVGESSVPDMSKMSTAEYIAARRNR